MEVFNRKHEDCNHELEPIRGSITILTVKLLVLLVVFDGLYTFIFYVLNLGIPLPFDLQHHIHISEALFGLQLINIIFQVVLLLNIILAWATDMYFLTEKHIIRRSGILHISEETYHYENIRSIAIKQSWLGKLFHYGDIFLKISASGGYQEDILLAGVENPQKYQAILKKLF